jgi:hypothetical protein
MNTPTETKINFDMQDDYRKLFEDVPAEDEGAII